MKFALDIPPGINLDDTAFSSDGMWRDCDKVRFWRKNAQVIGGWEKFIQDKLIGVCRNMLPWTNNLGNLNVAFGEHDALEVSYGGALYDITPTTFVAGNINGTGGAGYGTGGYGEGGYGEPSTADVFPLTWSLANYGESLMANPRGQTIFWWQNDTGVVAAPLTNAPAQVTYTLVTPSRQVMAFGCNEEVSGDFNGLCIRFSDIEEPTDWTTLPSNNAGEVIIEGGGRIVGARLIGAYVFVWTDHSLFLGTFTGNNAQPWIFQRQGDQCGLIGPNAAVIVDQQAFWMSADGQFRQCVLGGAPALIVSPVADEIRDHLDPTQVDKIVASSCAEFGEIRWDYPDTRDDIGRDGATLGIGDGSGDDLGVDDVYALAVEDDQVAGIESSRYVVVSKVDGVWARGIMARTAYVDAGPVLNQYPLGVDPNGNVYLHERGHSADGAAFDWFIESADQYLGAGEPFLMLRGMYPDFKDQLGTINMTVTVKRFPQSTEYEHGPYALEPSRPQRTFRASGRIARIKFSGNSSPTYARFGKIVFDTVSTGLQ